ncbi:PAS domain S-box protein [candidate division WOR-3 bacterium]|nr:PAS domain S-box protein [candidate division WOR-3 bacterium]
MKDNDKTKDQLINELVKMRKRIAELKASEDECQRMMGALQASEERYKELANSLPQTVFETDPKGNFSFVNRYGLLSFGYTKRGLKKGLNVFQMFIQEDKKRIKQNIRKIMKGEKVEDYEYTALKKDGSTFPVIIYSTLIFYKKKPIGLRGLLVDITQRKRIEEELRETRDYLENLINYANAPIIVWDPKFRITRFNRAFERLTEKSASEVLGEPLDILFPEDKRIQAMTHIHRTKSGERWEVVEIPILRADETVRTVLWNSATLYAADGKTVVATIAQGQDITEHKKAENELRESEKKYRELANLLPQSVFEMDREGNYTFANRYALESFGYSQEDLKKGLNALQLFIPEDRERVKQNIRKKLSGEEFKDHEYTALRKDGITFPVIIYTVPIIRKKKPVGLRGIAVDITERKKTEEELEAISLKDDLTGLYNRRGFFLFAEHHMRIANRTNRKFSLVIADLDELKQINDTFGHREGDLALIETVKVLKETFRESDVIARIGGDEFAIIVVEVSQDADEILTTRLQENLQTTDSKANRRYKLSISIGIACYEPRCPRSIDELMNQADRLMYKQKRSKKAKDEN